MFSFIKLLYIKSTFVEKISKIFLFLLTICYILYIIYIESKEERKIKMFEKMVNKVKNSSVVKFLLKECPEETNQYILAFQLVLLILLLVVKHFL